MTRQSILPRFGISTIDSTSCETADTRLAATIYAFDVPLNEANPYTTSAGDGLKNTRVVWNFQQSDTAGNSPKEIARLWADKVWQINNPDSPLSVCRMAFEEHDKLKRYLQLGRGLEVHYGAGTLITNTRKAAVLIALGHCIIGWRRNDQVTTWVFHQAAATDAALYDSPRLYERLPDTAISYARGAILGHEAMIAKIKDIQFVRVEHKGRIALVGRDMRKDKIDALEKLLYRK